MKARQSCSLYFVMVALLALTGCASPIHILTPVNGVNQEPVQNITASFTADFKPTEAWDIYLDGTPITGFTPPPAPGVTSTAPLVWAPRTSITSHTIKTNATCGTFCVYNSETVTFTPPQLLYNGTTTPTTGDLKQFVTTAEFVGVQYSRSVPITVTIAETSPTKLVQLGTSPGSLLPPGTPIKVIIPASTTKANFYVQGVSLGNYTLSITADGVVPTVGAGKVSP